MLLYMQKLFAYESVCAKCVCLPERYDVTPKSFVRSTVSLHMQWYHVKIFPVLVTFFEINDGWESKAVI